MEADFFAQYDDLAVEIVDRDAPIDDVGLSFSNRELAQKICFAMGWEDFDLFEQHDFQKVFEENIPENCLTYAFISFLRYRLFSEAQQRGIGLPAFNERAVAYSEYWYITLVERWNSHNPDKPSTNNWKN